jgi:segregation and condensation protein B
LESARDLPGLKELKSAGLLDSRPPPGSPELSDEKDAENDEQQTELFNSEDVK